MRCRCSCSAAVALLAASLVACGGGGGAARPDVFPDPRGPLDVHERTVSRSAKAQLELIRFRGAGGKEVDGVLALSRRPGRRPGVVFLTGSGGSMTDFLASAVEFADSGGVGLSIQQPPNAPSWAPLVENVRRALDVLAAQPDVDPKRLGLAGLSLGAETAAIVAGVDARPSIIALMSCRGGPVVRHYLGYARGDTFYVQNGELDEVVPQHELRLTIRAIEALHAPLRTSWYPTGHVLSAAAYKSQVDWLSSQLHAARQ